MITPIPWATFIIPALTKPTTITDVALDDWITAVTAVPSNTPLIGVLVSLNNVFSKLFPATLWRPVPISDIPNKNKATPHKIANIVVITLILLPQSNFFFIFDAPSIARNAVYR